MAPSGVVAGMALPLMSWLEEAEECMDVDVDDEEEEMSRIRMAAAALAAADDIAGGMVDERWNRYLVEEAR